jgi:hypothetical protein
MREPHGHNFVMAGDIEVDKDRLSADAADTHEAHTRSPNRNKAKIPTSRSGARTTRSQLYPSHHLQYLRLVPFPFACRRRNAAPIQLLGYPLYRRYAGCLHRFDDGTYVCRVPTGPGCPDFGAGETEDAGGGMRFCHGNQPTPNMRLFVVLPNYGQSKMRKTAGSNCRTGTTSDTAAAGAPQ